MFSYKKIDTRILYILEEVFVVLYGFPLCFFFSESSIFFIMQYEAQF